MSAAVNYSEPALVASYESRLVLDTRVMGAFYNYLHVIIDLIAKKDAYPEGVVSVSDGHVEFLRDQWRALLAHYAGPAAVAAAALLLAALMPLAGLLWCCCQWCRSTRRPRPVDRKYNGRSKAVLAILLIGLLTLLLFGVVCAFLTDAQLESGALAVPDTAAAGLRDVRTFLNTSAAHARHLLVDNYGELCTALSAMVDEWPSQRQLEHVKMQLAQLANHTLSLRKQATGLGVVLKRAKTSLNMTLAKCGASCNFLQSRLELLDIELTVWDEAEVSELLELVDRWHAARRGGLGDAFEPHVASVGTQLQLVADQITWAADNHSATLAEYERRTGDLRGFLVRYGPYRRWPTSAAAAALLAVVALLALGLLCGVCGKRPDAYGATDCCNKGTGATCLLCGVALMFAVAAGVALALLVYFAVGVAAQRLVCDPLAEPRGSRVWADVERFVQLERAMYGEEVEPDFNLTSVLVDCHANRTLYRALHLRRRYDLEQLQERARATLTEQVAALRGIQLSLPHHTRDKLHDLFKLNYYNTSSALSSLSLDSLEHQLNSKARELSSSASAILRKANAIRDPIVRQQLKDQASSKFHTVEELKTEVFELQKIHTDDVMSIKREIDTMKTELHQLIQPFVAVADEPGQDLAREFAEAVGARLQAYLARVAHAAEHDVARCGPLSHAFNTTRDQACKATLLPVNGFWMSVAWCVLLWVPLLLLAPRLARQYRHADFHLGQRVSSSVSLVWTDESPRYGEVCRRVNAKAASHYPSDH